MHNSFFKAIRSMVYLQVNYGLAEAQLPHNSMITYFDAASDMPAFYQPSMGAAIIFLQKCAVCALAYPGCNFLVLRCHHERPSLFDRDGDGTPDRRDSQPNNPNRS
jgi:hypothetical protein